jgi:hypothetical protein
VTLDPAALQQTARDHPWGHASGLGVCAADGVAAIGLGEGCYVWDLPNSASRLALAGAMKEMP